MKFLSYLLLVFCLPVCALGQLKGLEDGARAFLMVEKRGHTISPEEDSSACLFMGYHNGFIAAVTMSPVMFGIKKREDHEFGALNTAQWETKSAATSFLAFVDRHKPLGFDSSKTQSISIFTAWYCFTHPSATPAHWQYAKKLVVQAFGEGARNLDDFTKKP